MLRLNKPLDEKLVREPRPRVRDILVGADVVQTHALAGGGGRARARRPAAPGPAVHRHALRPPAAADRPAEPRRLMPAWRGSPDPPRRERGQPRARLHADARRAAHRSRAGAGPRGRGLGRRALRAGAHRREPVRARAARPPRILAHILAASDRRSRTICASAATGARGPALRITPQGFDPAAYWPWRPPGGETLLEVAERAGAVLDRVAQALGLTRRSS